MGGKRRITILSYGSQGDVQPYLALALGLAQAGHAVRLAAPEMFSAMARERARGLPPGMLEFAPLPGDPTRLMRAAASPSPLLAPLPRSVRMGLTVARHMGPLVTRLIEAAQAACAGSDLIIHTLLTTIVGHEIATQTGARDLSALIFPVFSATGSFPNPLFAPWPGWMRRFGPRAASIGHRYHYLTHREFSRVFWHGNRIAVDLLRRRSPQAAALINPLHEWPFEWPADILPGAAQPTPVMYGISRHALPCPPDMDPAAAARMCERMTGYWFLDAPPGWRPPAALERFLESGPPPVFIGFGSVVSRQAARLAREAVEALRLTGQRGVLLRGWGGLEAADLPPEMIAIDHAPFDWLYPRMAAVVHHGGMGTAAAAMRAGVPQMGVPFAFDQPFWGRQVHALGVGPAPLWPGQFNARALAESIAAMVSDPRMRRAARALGARIRAEDGVGAAVRLIESVRPAVA